MLGWSRDVLTSIIAKYPPVRTRILEQIARHMTDALDRVQELATERVDQRLAKTILRLGANGGRRTAAGTEIVHPITRQELADLVGATLFTVSRVIARWEEDGVLKSARSRIVIADAARLEQLAESPPD